MARYPDQFDHNIYSAREQEAQRHEIERIKVAVGLLGFVVAALCFGFLIAILAA